MRLLVAVQRREGGEAFLLVTEEIGDMLDIEESTSRSQYTRAKAMLEDILIRKRIIPIPKEKTNWRSTVKVN
jgi:hypothetical protein